MDFYKKNIIDVHSANGFFLGSDLLTSLISIEPSIKLIHAILKEYNSILFLY
jgi:hypothetical protein